MQDTVDQAHSAVSRTLADIIEDARLDRAFWRTQRIAATTSSCGTGYVTPLTHSR